MRENQKPKPEHPETEAKQAQAQDEPTGHAPSKDPFEQGYNRGMDDGKEGRKRQPHSLKLLPKMVLMSGAKVEQYVKGYHQGYDFAVKSKRTQHEREITGDAQYQKRLERRQTIRQQVSKARELEQQSPEL